MGRIKQRLTGRLSKAFTLTVFELCECQDII